VVDFGCRGGPDPASWLRGLVCSFPRAGSRLPLSSFCHDSLQVSEGAAPFFESERDPAYGAAFIALCEGYLGIEPNLTLWRYFFCVELLRKTEEQRVMEAWPVGCASISASDFAAVGCVRTSRFPFPFLTRASTDVGFICGMPVRGLFWGCSSLAWTRAIRPRPPKLELRCYTQGKTRIRSHMSGVLFLREKGVTGASVIGAYLRRGVAPLKAQDGEGFFVPKCRGPSKQLRGCLMGEPSIGH
jgi:hypothetical protein